MQKFVTTGALGEARRSGKRPREKGRPPDDHVLSISVPEAGGGGGPSSLPSPPQVPAVHLHPQPSSSGGAESSSLPSTLGPPPPPPTAAEAEAGLARHLRDPASRLPALPRHTLLDSADSQSLRLTLGPSDEEEPHGEETYDPVPADSEPRRSTPELWRIRGTRREASGVAGEGLGPGFLPYMGFGDPPPPPPPQGHRDSSSSSNKAWATAHSSQTFRHSAQLIPPADLPRGKRRERPERGAPLRNGHHVRSTKRRRRRRGRQLFDYSMHRWLLLGVIGAFLVWAAIFFPILLAANEQPPPLPPNQMRPGGEGLDAG